MLVFTAADKGDGSGATGAITGADAGSSSSAFVAPWTNGALLPTTFGPIVGNGSLNLSLANGYYVAWAAGTVAGEPATSQPFTFPTSGGDVHSSLHAALAAQVQTIIQGMLGTSIVGISSTSVRVRKTAYMGDFSARNPLPSNFSYSLPGIVLCYFDVEEVADATNARDEIGYPITIVFAQESQSAATPSEANADQFLRWREAVERTFTHLRGCPNQLINVTANGLNYQFYDCRMTGGMIIDPDASTNKKLDIGWLKFSFRTWRGKNNT